MQGSRGGGRGVEIEFGGWIEAGCGFDCGIVFVLETSAGGRA